jgi:hypothetical protein
LPKTELVADIKDVIEAHIYSIIPEWKSQKLSNLAIRETLMKTMIENANINEERSLKEKIHADLDEMNFGELKKVLKEIEALKKERREKEKEVRKEKEKHLKEERQKQSKERERTKEEKRRKKEETSSKKTEKQLKKKGKQYSNKNTKNSIELL